MGLIVDFVVEVVLVLFLAALASAIAGGLTMAVTYKLRRGGVIATVLAALTGVWLVGSHCWASSQMTALKQQFYHEAAGDYTLVAGGVNDSGSVAYADYGGSLDAIVSRRDKVLAQHGFVCLGGWRTGDNGTTTAAFYLYLGSLVRRS